MLSLGAADSGDVVVPDDDSDDDSVSMRLKGLERHSGQHARLIFELPREVSELQRGYVSTNRIVHDLQIEVSTLQLWKQWLHEVWRWMLGCFRSFPWP
jgi:hypothetical protein